MNRALLGMFFSFLTTAWLAAQDVTITLSAKGVIQVDPPGPIQKQEGQTVLWMVKNNDASDGPADVHIVNFKLGTGHNDPCVERRKVARDIPYNGSKTIKTSVKMGATSGLYKYEVWVIYESKATNLDPELIIMKH